MPSITEYFANYRLSLSFHDKLVDMFVVSFPHDGHAYLVSVTEIDALIDTLNRIKQAQSYLKEVERTSNS